MSIEETIKTLEMAKAEVEWNYPLDYAIAIDNAIECLNKDIPKIATRCESNRYVFQCPTCLSFVGYKSRETYSIKNRCESCGQQIKWEES